MLSLEFQKNGKTVSLTENDLFDFRFERGCFSGDTFELGGVNSYLVYCVIDNNDRRFPRGSFANSRLTLYVDGTYCGQFNTELPKRRGGVIELYAYDDMIKLDCEYPDKYEFPQTFKAVYGQCVLEAGLVDEFSLDSVQLNALFNDGVISHEYTEYIYANSCRNLVSGMAEWNGGFAHINKSGVLQVDVFSKDVKKTLYSGELMEFDYSDETVTFSKIRTSQKNKTYEMGDDTGYTLNVRNQYIGYGLEDGDFERYFGFIHDYYDGFSLTPMTLTLAEPDLTLEIGDRISVVDEEEDVTVTGNISKIVIRGNCSMEITCGGFGNAGSASNYKPTSLSQTAQAKTEAKTASGGGGGVGKASDWDNTSEYFNDYENNVAGDKNAAGKKLYATAMGQKTAASGFGSVAMGGGTKATGSQSVAMGVVATASGSQSLAGGSYCTASGGQSIAFGQNANATAPLSFSLGFMTTASAPQAFAAGYGSKASGQASAAFGKAEAAGPYSFAAGGDGVKAGGDSAFAGGRYAETSNSYAMAFGNTVKAKHYASAAIGYCLETAEPYQLVIGIGNNVEGSKGCLFVVGNNLRGGRTSNAFTVDNDGNVVCAGTLTAANKTVFIDHEPTADDLIGTERLIVQYDPSINVNDLRHDYGYGSSPYGTKLYKVVNVFAEIFQK